MGEEKWGGSFSFSALQFAGLNLSGKIDNFIDNLHISVIGVTKMDATSLKNLPANLSKLAALELFIVCKGFKTISPVVGLNVKFRLSMFQL